jgi:uncharacterized C2H2 Zn-finger protein
MTDDSSAPVDLSTKRKFNDLESKAKKKIHSRSFTEGEIPLDLSFKSHSTHPQIAPLTSMPFYDPNNLLYNSSALLYDLFLANLNVYCHQQRHIQPARPKLDQLNKSVRTSSLTSSRSIKETVNHSNSKHESFACSCGEKYSNVAQLVSHLKMTNHSAQLSSNHDEVAKLVRGQDIWLSRDTNPANQILKCLRCSLSFETLPDLTAHMMKTNHFTQLLPSNTAYSHSTSKTPTTTAAPPPTSKTNMASSRSTCLVCSQQFVCEVDLVDHLQRLHHIRYNCTTCGMYFENENLYKDHLMKEMHHRNGKSAPTRQRDSFVQPLKSSHKRSNVETR